MGDAGDSERSFEEQVGAAVAALGVLFVIASVVLSVASFSGCGACWPGSCQDSGATPTPDVTVTPTGDPTPTPTLFIDCSIGRSPGLIDENLYQSEADGCPRVLLDPEGASFDESLSICEHGTVSFGEEIGYTFRFDCNASSPWVQAAATLDTETRELSILMSCPGGTVPFDEEFLNALVLEDILFQENGQAINAAQNGWEQACLGQDASDELLLECNAVCSEQKSLLAAMTEVDMVPTDPAVVCYLQLYDPPPAQVGDTTVTSEDGVLRLQSRCGCPPNQAFVDCMAGIGSEPCYANAETYDTECGAACWAALGTESSDCTFP